MRGRIGLWASLALSAAIVGVAVGAAAQQQAPAARRTAAPAKPSIFDRLAKMVATQGAQPASAPPADPTTPQPLAVNWAVASRYAQAPATSRGARVTGVFVARNRAAIDSLSVPVLLPGDPDLAIGLRIFPHGDFYTISSNASGLSFVMTGHSKAFPVPAGALRGLGKGGLAGRIPADGVVIEANDVGLDANFTRFGAAYSIALECRLKQADPRCASDAYVRGVISRMIVVTPAGRG